MASRATTAARILDPAAISEVIEMALSDEIAFADIERQYSLSPDDIKTLMRTHLKPGSYKAWRKRVRRMRDQRPVYK